MILSLCLRSNTTVRFYICVQGLGTREVVETDCATRLLLHGLLIFISFILIPAFTPVYEILWIFEFIRISDTDIIILCM